MNNKFNNEEYTDRNPHIHGGEYFKEKKCYQRVLTTQYDAK
jgi:ethanolamine utilization protein EutP (predicted NTPase)